MCIDVEPHAAKMSASIVFCVSMGEGLTEGWQSSLRVSGDCTMRNLLRNVGYRLQCQDVITVCTATAATNEVQVRAECERRYVYFPLRCASPASVEDTSMSSNTFRVFISNELLSRDVPSFEAVFGIDCLS